MIDELVAERGNGNGPGPDPGFGDLSQFSGSSRPPGADKLIELLHWLSWGISGVLIAGVLLATGKMALAFHGGRGQDGIAHLAWVAFACVVAGAASAIVGHLL